MEKYMLHILLFASLLYISGCGVGGSGGGEPETVVLNVTRNMEEAGSLSLTSAEFQSGDTARVEAFPYNGYGFVEWSGDRTSSENPYSFIIEEDTDLVANFEATSSEYRVHLSVADTSDTLNVLRFGQLTTATDGIDQEDYPAAPPPPPENLHAYFQHDEDLFWDYRNAETPTVTWNLQLQPGQTDSLHFSWTLNETVLNGSVTLRSEDASIEVDMIETGELSIEKGEADHLLIEYELGN
ncbi:hypothetical protein ACG2F4_03140 [Halalkalibaculum sp. DA3122]|uniref:InlB B-repeat-containing protein n=1 Tax=Halalkalibaculum sp. DA3122 TaxID=3373607 RepID=UPI0037543058